MTPAYHQLKVTDELGTDYSDLFADLAPDWDGTIIPARARSLRANEDGPLGALIVRWIQAHIETPADLFAWQYLDGADIHTIAYAEDDELHLVNIFGRVHHGRRAHQLHDITEPLGLRVERISGKAG